MSEPVKIFDVNSDHSLSNSAAMGPSDVPSFRNPIPGPSGVNSGFGPPVLPPRPDLTMQTGYGMNSGMSYGGMGGYGK